MNNLKFCDDNVSNIEQSVLSAYEKLAGVSLADAEPITIFLKSLAYVIAEQRSVINTTANQNMLATATGVYLDALGELVGVSRFSGGYASVTVRFFKSTNGKNVLVKAGTRVTADAVINFTTVDDVVIKDGVDYADILCVATIAGTKANGYEVGTITKLVDVTPYISSIENTTISSNGDDVESDNSYRERIRIAPESYSVAGPVLAYKAQALSVSPIIADVAVQSKVAGTVNIYLLLEGGNLPTNELISQVKAHLSDEKIRPLTDNVVVESAKKVTYDINLTYYLYDDNLISEEQVTEAVNQYNAWQSEKLGRDINPDELIFKLKSIGVKRVDVTKPNFTSVSNESVAIVRNISLNLGGVEDE